MGELQRIKNNAECHQELGYKSTDKNKKALIQYDDKNIYVTGSTCEPPNNINMF